LVVSPTLGIASLSTITRFSCSVASASSWGGEQLLGGGESAREVRAAVGPDGVELRPEGVQVALVGALQVSDDRRRVGERHEAEAVGALEMGRHRPEGVSRDVDFRGVVLDRLALAVVVVVVLAERLPHRARDVEDDDEVQRLALELVGAEPGVQADREVLLGGPGQRIVGHRRRVRRAEQVGALAGLAGVEVVVVEQSLVGQGGGLREVPLPDVSPEHADVFAAAGGEADVAAGASGAVAALTAEATVAADRAVVAAGVRTAGREGGEQGCHRLERSSASLSGTHTSRDVCITINSV
jgi:hypothetical protein